MATCITNPDEWHTFHCNGHQFKVPIRYQDPFPMETSAFDVTVRALDTTTGKQVAIKKRLHPFQSQEHARRTYRDLKSLMYLNHPDAQVLQLYNVFTHENNQTEFPTVYFVSKFAGFSLHQVIQRHRPFREDHIRLIIYQIFRGLKFIHSTGTIHRDLKPSEIGIDENANITILNFDSAIFLTDGELPEYVFARWYRAPERFLNDKQYDTKVDIWSAGCIMAELILLRPVFRGADSVDQLNKMFEILGTPDIATLHEKYTPEVRDYISGLPPRQKQDFSQLFGFKYDADAVTPISGVSPQGIDLLDRLLSLDHRKRPTAVEVLAHPFFGYFHDPTDEPSIEPLNDEHFAAQYTTEKWKSLILQLMEEFEPPLWINDDLDND